MLALAAAPGSALASGPVFARVSNLRTSTSWAYPQAEAAIRSSPSPMPRLWDGCAS